MAPWPPSRLGSPQWNCHSGLAAEITSQQGVPRVSLTSQAKVDPPRWTLKARAIRSDAVAWSAPPWGIDDHHVPDPRRLRCADVIEMR